MALDLRIGLVDGDDDIRFGRRQIIDSQADLKVVLEDSSVESSYERVPEALIDVLVIDHRLRGGDGITLATKLINKYLADDSKIPAIVMTGSYFSEELKLASMRAGATDLVTQDQRPESLLRAIRASATKQDLPNYGVFDDKRVFAIGKPQGPLVFRGRPPQHQKKSTFF